ncbi:MAG: hypothetical protein LBP75_10125 [Planctomycetota bacterium]|jgi:hypothetical protein|nr:hypothetical protein [Planctomycetota bacterium]
MNTNSLWSDDAYRRYRETRQQDCDHNQRIRPPEQNFFDWLAAGNRQPDVVDKVLAEAIRQL